MARRGGRGGREEGEEGEMNGEAVVAEFELDGEEPKEGAQSVVAVKVSLRGRRVAVEGRKGKEQR